MSIFIKKSKLLSFGLSFSPFTIFFPFFKIEFHKKSYKEAYFHYSTVFPPIFNLEDALYDKVGDKITDLAKEELVRSGVLSKVDQPKDFSLLNMSCNYDAQGFIEMNFCIVFDQAMINQDMVAEYKLKQEKWLDRKKKIFERKYKRLKWYHKLFQIARFVF